MLAVDRNLSARVISERVTQCCSRPATKRASWLQALQAVVTPHAELAARVSMIDGPPPEVQAIDEYDPEAADNEDAEQATPRAPGRRTVRAKRVGFEAAHEPGAEAAAEQDFGNMEDAEEGWTSRTSQHFDFGGTPLEEQDSAWNLPSEALHSANGGSATANQRCGRAPCAAHAQLLPIIVSLLYTWVTAARELRNNVCLYSFQGVSHCEHASPVLTS